MQYTIDFIRGYNWAALEKEYQEWESQEWKKGFDKFHSDMTRSESIRWH